MHLSLIVVTDENNGIGINGDQPAFISADLKRFKALTTGHTIVMGRKTFEALPNGALPNRRNIMLTRQDNYWVPNCEVVTSAHQLAKICSDNEKVFVIGGGEIYKLFLNEAQDIYLTLIHHSFPDIDTWFPDIAPNKWQKEKAEGPFKDEKSGLSFSYLNYATLNH
jgi:dihydrofolate reductase